VAVSNNFNELASIMTEQLFLNIPEGKKKVDDMTIVYKWNRQDSFEDKELQGLIMKTKKWGSYSTKYQDSIKL